MGKSSTPTWRKVFWWIGIFVTFNLSLYILLPKVAAYFIERQFEAQGLKDVRVLLDYPGVRRTTIPLVSFQVDLESETAILTLKELTLTYRLPKLFVGHIDQIQIDSLSLDIVPLDSKSESSAQPDAPSSSVRTAPSASATLALLSRPLPPLPFDHFSLGKATIYRAQATGPLKRLEIAGVVEHQKGTLNAAITAQGERTSPYTLAVVVKPNGETNVVLKENQSSSEPLLAVESKVQTTSESIVHWQGTAIANFKSMTPFLALLMPIGQDLEKVDGSLRVGWEGSTNQTGPLDVVIRDPSSALSGTFHMDVNLPAWAKIAESLSANLDGQFAAASEGVTVELLPKSQLSAYIKAEGLPIPREMYPVPGAKPTPLTIEAKDQIVGVLSFEQEHPVWMLEGPIQTTYANASAPIGVEVMLERAAGSLFELLQIEGQFDTWGNLPEVATAQFDAKNVKWKIKGRMSQEQDTIRVEVDARSLLQSQSIRVEKGQIPRAGVQFVHTFPVTYTLNSQQWKAGPTELRIALPRVRWEQQIIKLSRAHLKLQEVTGDGATWSTKGTLKVSGVSTTVGKLTTPSSNWGFGFSATPENITVGVLGETVLKTFLLKGRVEHNLTTRTGKLKASLMPQPFSRSGLTLKKLLHPWNYPFDLTSGQLSATTVLTWGPDPQAREGGFAISRGDVTISLNDIDGYYQKVLVDGVSTTMQAVGTGPTHFTMLAPSKVTVKRINTGIEVKDLTFEVRVGMSEVDAHPTVEMQDVSAKVFGGQVTSKRIYVDRNRPPNFFTVKLVGLKFEEFLQLEQQKGLQGTGLLDGIVPITINKTTVEVINGKLEARAPGGVIQFQPLEATANTLIQAKPQMGIVLQALRNFQYDVLNAGMNYQPNGTLLLETRLEGKSLDLKPSRPIHFNLNIEENIPALLKSLRVVKGIEENLEKFFQAPMF